MKVNYGKHNKVGYQKRTRAHKHTSTTTQHAIHTTCCLVARILCLCEPFFIAFFRHTTLHNTTQSTPKLQNSKVVAHPSLATNTYIIFESKLWKIQQSSIPKTRTRTQTRIDNHTTRNTKRLLPCCSSYHFKLLPTLCIALCIVLTLVRELCFVNIVNEKDKNIHTITQAS